jgi:hypothetical protein
MRLKFSIETFKLAVDEILLKAKSNGFLKKNSTDIFQIK